MQLRLLALPLKFIPLFFFCLCSRVESNFCHLFQLHSRYCIDRLRLADTDTGDVIVTLRVAIIRALSLPEHYCRFYCCRASCCCETSSAAARESMDRLGAKRNPLLFFCIRTPNASLTHKNFSVNLSCSICVERTNKDDTQANVGAK